MGQKNSNPFSFTNTSKGNGHHNGTMERKNLPRQDSSKGATFRFLTGGMGRGRCNNWSFVPGVLERQKDSPHQCERIGGSNKHSPIFVKK